MVITGNVLAPPPCNVLAPPCDVTRLWEETKDTVLKPQRPRSSAVIALQIILSAFMYVCSYLNSITLRSCVFTYTQVVIVVAVVVALLCHYKCMIVIAMVIRIWGYMSTNSTLGFDIYVSLCSTIKAACTYLFEFVVDKYQYSIMLSCIVVCVSQRQFIKWFVIKNFTLGLIIIIMLQNIMLLDTWLNKPGVLVNVY